MAAVALNILLFRHDFPPRAVGPPLDTVVGSALRIAKKGQSRVEFAQEMSGPSQFDIRDELRSGPRQFHPLRKRLAGIGAPKIRRPVGTCHSADNLRGGVGGLSRRDAESQGGAAFETAEESNAP